MERGVECIPESRGKNCSGRKKRRQENTLTIIFEEEIVLKTDSLSWSLSAESVNLQPDTTLRTERRPTATSLCGHTCARVGFHNWVSVAPGTRPCGHIPPLPRWRDFPAPESLSHSAYVRRACPLDRVAFLRGQWSPWSPAAPTCFPDNVPGIADHSHETGGRVCASSSSLGTGLLGGQASPGQGGVATFASAQGGGRPHQSPAEPHQKDFAHGTPGPSSAPRTCLLREGPTPVVGRPSASACALCLPLCIVQSPVPGSLLQGCLGLGQALWSRPTRASTPATVAQLHRTVGEL